MMKISFIRELVLPLPGDVLLCGLGLECNVPGTAVAFLAKAMVEAVT